MKKTFACVLLWVLCSQVVWAAAPRTFSYQGVLTNASGVVVPDGSYNMTFRIYNVVAGGTHLWEEVLSVPVASGRFNVVLGKTTSLDALPFDVAYWLGVKVGSDAEMSPRIELTGSPYALMARTVENNAVTSGKIANSTVVRSLNGLEDNVNLLQGANVTITQEGNDLRIASTGGGADSDWVISSNNMYAGVSGNVGIGTTSPSNKLDIVENDDIAVAQVRSLLSTGAAQVTVANSGSARLDMTTFGPEWALPWAGVPMANLSWLYAAGGPMMLASGDAVYTVINGGVKAKVTGTEFNFYGVGLVNQIACIRAQDWGGDLAGGSIEVLDEEEHLAGGLNAAFYGGGSLELYPYGAPPLDPTIQLFGGMTTTSGEPTMHLYGSSRTMTCDMSVAGNASVIAPNDAISASRASVISAWASRKASAQAGATGEPYSSEP